MKVPVCAITWKLRAMLCSYKKLLHPAGNNCLDWCCRWSAMRGLRVVWRDARQRSADGNIFKVQSRAQLYECGMLTMRISV